MLFQGELDVVAVAPRLRAFYHRFDRHTLKAADALELILNNTLFELQLGLVGDMLPVATAAAVASEVRAGGWHTLR